MFPVYTLRAVALIPKDRIRRVFQFDKDITDAISTFKHVGPKTPDNHEWELPICLKSFAVEADCEHLLEIMDIAVAHGAFRIWEEATKILCRFKAVDKIGMSRVFASVKEFSFKKVQHL